MAVNIEIPFDWPRDWTEWIAILDQWYQTTQLPVDISAVGINNVSALKDWLLNQGFAIATNPDGTIEILKVELLDAANSNMSLPVPIETFEEVAGTAGTIASYSLSKGSWAGVKKAAIIGVVASLFAVQMAGAQEVGQSVREDLEAFLDDYVIPGTQLVKVYMENGIPHIQEEILQGIRERLVALGVYDTEFVPPDTPDALVNFTSYSGYSGSFTPLQYTQTAPYVNYKTQYYFGNADYPIKGFGESSGSTITILDTPLYYLIGYSPSGNPSLPYYERTICIFRDDTPLELGRTYQVFNTNDVPVGTMTVGSYTINGRTVICATSSGLATQSWYEANGSPALIQDSTLPAAPIEAYMAMYGTGAHPVAGLIPTDTSAKDPTKTIADLLPIAWDDKKQLAYPVEGNLFNKKNFLPVNIETDDPYEDGTSQTSEEAQEGTVPDDDNAQKDILDSLPDIIRQYMEDTGVTGGDGGDSGDTPPEEPPLIDAAGNGLWAIYNPTKAQVNSFGQWLWSSNIVDQITRMFNSPIDAVIGFHMIYCTPVKGGSEHIMCGYLDSGVSSITVANQYATIDCGTVDVSEYYRTALDYTATKLSLYLPFIGFVPLSTAVCMGSTLSVVYRIDVLTGTCLAQVKVIKENSEAVMYTFPGNCSVQVPLTATTYTGMVSTLVGVANTAIGVAMDSPGSAIAGAKQALGGAVESLGTGGVKQSGAIGSNAGVLGIRIPYLIITHPVSYDAFEYSKQYGYPLNETVTLGSLSGYTKIKDIHLHGIPCTDDELEMIERLLKDGVIIN